MRLLIAECPFDLTSSNSNSSQITNSEKCNEPNFRLRFAAKTEVFLKRYELICKNCGVSKAKIITKKDNVICGCFYKLVKQLIQNSNASN